jgi:hypothetical protein
MKKLLRLLLICSNASLVFASCSPIPTKGYSRQAGSDHQFTPVFDDSFQKALYEVDIAYGKKSISGVAVIKKMEANQSSRIVLISETGLKFFDFEFFRNDSCVVHYAMDAMNQKKVIRTFTTDLGLIVKNSSDKKMLTYFDADNSGKGYYIKEKRQGCNYYHSKEIRKQPTEIHRKTFLSPSTDVEISYNPEGIPATIYFTHGIIDLAMEFKLINEQNDNR